MKLKYVIIIFCFLIVGFDILLQFSYLNPKESSLRDEIDVYQEPYQLTYTKMKKPIIIKDLYNRPYGLDAQASYSISGMIVAKNYNFGSRLLMKKGFGSIALMDYGIVNGELCDKDFIKKNFKFTSQDVVFARQLTWKYNQKALEKYSKNYINSHISHVHLIPKNHNVMSALMKAKKYDKIKLNGYLVDVFDDKAQRFAMTSLSRTDTNETSRGAGQGGGACEIMYVLNVQINNKFYE